MVRLIIIGLAIYLAYRWLIAPKKKKAPPAGPAGELPVADEMIQDPYCGAYFPSSKGFPAKVDGRRLVFCSEACRDKYLARYRAHDVKEEGED